MVLVVSLPACRACLSGTLARDAAVVWGALELQQAMVQIGLECAEADVSRRLGVEGARERLAALAEAMSGPAPGPVCASVFMQGH